MSYILKEIKILFLSFLKDLYRGVLRVGIYLTTVKLVPDFFSEKCPAA